MLIYGYQVKEWMISKRYQTRISTQRKQSQFGTIIIIINPDSNIVLARSSPHLARVKSMRANTPCCLGNLLWYTAKVSEAFELAFDDDIMCPLQSAEEKGRHFCWFGSNDEEMTQRAGNPWLQKGLAFTSNASNIEEKEEKCWETWGR